MSAFPDRPEFPALIEKFGNKPPVSSQAGLGSFRTRDFPDVVERVEQARINHAEEARAVLAEVVSGEGNIPVDWAGISDNEQWMISASYAEAQVHATLAVHEQTAALVEQQRIANIIAYWQLHTPRSAVESFEHDYIEVHQLHHDSIDIDDMVREGLGLS